MGLRTNSTADHALTSCKSALEALLAQRTGCAYQELVVAVMGVAYAAAAGCKPGFPGMDTSGNSTLDKLRQDENLGRISEADTLRELFEELLAMRPSTDAGVAVDSSLLKTSGTYYTPRYIAEYIVEKTLEPLLMKSSHQSSELAAQGLTGQQLLRPYIEIAVLDAASGTGRFLSAAARKITAGIFGNSDIVGQLGMSRDEVFALVVENCLYGVDIDAAALHAAALSLIFEARLGRKIPKRLRRHLRPGNALRSADMDSCCLRLPGMEDDSFDWRIEFNHIFQRDPAGFDAVIGNPPWISFSGRGASKIDKDFRKYLYNRWGSIRGWPSSHGIFLEIATQLCRDGGMIGQIFPEQVLDLSRYADARRAIWANTRLVGSPIKVDERAFAGVTSPACILILEKTSLVSSSMPDSVRADLELTIDGLKKVHDSEQALANLVYKMKRFQPLPPHSFGDPGVHTGNCAKLLVSRNPCENAEPLRIGRDITSYRLSPASRWLKFDVIAEEGRYFGIRTLEKYTRSRVLIRQTAAYPIAARHTSPTYFRNSALAYYGSEEVSDEYLLALLNSRLVRFFHQYEHRDGRQRAFPQVKVRHLNSIPVPRIRRSSDNESTVVEILERSGFAPDSAALPNPEGSENVLHALMSLGLEEHYDLVFTALVKRIEALRESAELAQGTAAKSVEQLIDEMVYSLYGLDDGEREAIDRFLDRMAK